MINIKHKHTYIGPNIYSSKPVIEILVGIDSAILPDALKKITLINQCFAHWFSWPPNNSPLSQKDIALFLVDFARAVLVEIRGAINVAKVIQDGNQYLAILGYHNAQVSLAAMNFVAKLFLNIENLSKPEISKSMKEFWSICHKFHPDFEAQVLIDYCEKHNIPYRNFMPGTPYWQYGSGNKSMIFIEASPVTDNFAWSKNKSFGKMVFRNAGAPIARSVLVENEGQLNQAVKQVGFPCVIKPLDLGLGKGVLTNLRDIESVTNAYRYAKKFTNEPIMLEHYAEGEIHRLLVIRGKLWKTIRRDRPFVIGDGKSTIKLLVEQMNNRIAKHMRPGGAFGYVLPDEIFFATLKGQGLGVDSVPEKGKKIVVRGVATSGQGSVYYDVSEQVHPDTKLMSETLASVFGIESCGLDFITEDISKSCFDAGIFIEINCTPGLKTPEIVGVDRDEIGRVILGPVPGRIPLILVISPEQYHEEIKTVIPSERTIGWVCGVQSGIGNTKFPGNANAVHISLNRILKNTTVSAAVVVCDAESIVKLGMPVDKTETTVLYNQELENKWIKVLEDNSNELVRLKKLKKLYELFTLHLPLHT